MTYEEAEAIARQLTLAWRDAAEGGDVRVKWRWAEEEFKYELRFGHLFTFSGLKGGDWRLTDRKVVRKKRCAPFFIQIGGLVFDESTREFYCESVAEHLGESQAEFDTFAREWEEVFRRCLWLAGLSIECTGHERVEWGRYAARNGLPLDLVTL